MKLLDYLLIAALLGIFFSCASDDVDNDTITTEEAEQLESVQLEADEVSSNVIISGANKLQGNPPSPNGAISLDVSNSTSTAFLGEGFDITLSSDGNPVGAYIQFRSNDGIAAQEYFDVNIAANSAGKGINATFLNRLQSKSGTFLAKNEDTTINVDFGLEIPPGQFCYEICVYDEQGNISEPQEVCVTVESWGGKDDMDGNWVMVREERSEDGQNIVFETGQEACYSYTFECANGQVIEADECYNRISGEVRINGDGSYRAVFNGTERWLDEGASYENCLATYIEETFEDISEGQWAFVNSNNRLTIVEYYFKGMVNGDLDEEYTLETGDARLVLDGTIVLDGNSFVITESRDEDGDGVEEVNIYFFDRQ
ncbi:MAG: hypothetical protein ACR2MM_05815 [Flavobacteriaceae bacterium]